jgi:putative ABC transport system permease protein
MMLWKEKARFIITSGGVGVTVMLMLFLFGIYEGAKIGAMSYVINSPAEIWMCQNNSTNLLRSSSFFHSSIGNQLMQAKEVDQVGGLLRVLTTARIKEKLVTVFLFGFDPGSGLGAPPKMIRGTSKISRGEIILDMAFAAKNNLEVDALLMVQGYEFKVVGISEGTNMIAAQFAFTTLEDSQVLLGLSDIVSFYMLTTDGTKDVDALIESFSREFPSFAFFNRREFADNNLDEMTTGILPVLWTIAVFGSIIGIAVITLMLYGSVIERREDYALLKSIGASHKFLLLLVLKQSLIGALTGFAFGLMLDLVFAPVIVRVVPEILLTFTWRAGASVFIASLFMGTAGALAPVQKLTRIYPAEVFRA